MGTFKRSGNFDEFARKRGDTVQFAFEADGDAIDVGLISSDDVTVENLIDFAHKHGIHGKPIWVSESFTPILQQPKLSIS